MVCPKAFVEGSSGAQNFYFSQPQLALCWCCVANHQRLYKQEGCQLCILQLWRVEQASEDQTTFGGRLLPLLRKEDCGNKMKQILLLCAKAMRQQMRALQRHRVILSLAVPGRRRCQN